MIPGASDYSNIVPHGGNTESSEDKYLEHSVLDQVSQSGVFSFEVGSWEVPTATADIDWLHQSLPLTRPHVRPGLFPKIQLTRFHAHGTVHWFDDGVHTQSYVPASSQDHVKLSPNVFLALVYDRDPPAMYNSIPGHLAGIVDFPVLDLDAVFDMSIYRGYGVWPTSSQSNPLPPEPGPAYLPVDPHRYEVLWSTSLIPDQTPAATFDLISRITVADPGLVEDEFMWNARNMYFSCTVDLDHPVYLEGSPADGSNPPRYNPRQGCLFFVAFYSGGVIDHSGALRQLVSITAATHVLYKLTPQ